MTLFQSTLPREERHCLIVKTSLYSYFNPRSHERSDLKRCKYMRYKIISIHAPTRGATFSLNEVLRCPDISIHAPTRGATVPASASHSSVVFQSTLPREERQIHIQFFLSKTPYFNPRSHERSDPVTLFCDYQGGFQSTLPREERPQDAFSLMPLSRFQSTLPREERQLRVSNLTLAKYFNPRSHERSDLMLLCMIVAL